MSPSEEARMVGDGQLMLWFLTLLQYSSAAKGAVALGEALLGEKSPDAERTSRDVISREGKLYSVKYEGDKLTITAKEKLKIDPNLAIPPYLQKALTRQSNIPAFESKFSIEMRVNSPNHTMRLESPNSGHIPSLIKDYLTTLLPRHQLKIEQDYNNFTGRAATHQLYSILIPSKVYSPTKALSVPREETVNYFSPQEAGMSSLLK